MGLEARDERCLDLCGWCSPAAYPGMAELPSKEAPDFALGTPPSMSSPSHARWDRIFRDVWGIQDPLG